MYFYFKYFVVRLRECWNQWDHVGVSQLPAAQSSPSQGRLHYWIKARFKGSQRDVVYLGWPISALVYAGEGVGVLLANKYSCARPNKLWRSNSIFNLLSCPLRRIWLQVVSIDWPSLKSGERRLWNNYTHPLCYVSPFNDSASASLIAIGN